MSPVPAEEMHERTQQDEQERSVIQYDLPTEEIGEPEHDCQAKDGEEDQTLIGTAEHPQGWEGD